ncbi:MAG: GAF domain-containing protein [Comamonadaceae bacterium]|nr:MAG: GAF domain-containing protein [Comamonadaceae bacterium]
MHAVTLSNCDREPIHIPGHIQAIGALLAFGPGGSLAWCSANAAELLNTSLPQLGQTLDGGHFGGDPVIHGAIAHGLASPADQSDPDAYEIDIAGDMFDLIVHRSGPQLVVEFEKRSADNDRLSTFALKAHRGMDRLRRQRTVQELLEVAVEEVRQLTGFDRVMAYRFRHDDSGDVVAESRIAELEPFLNRRYPASDIPAQARRLYIINTLRLISDVASAPVPVHGRSPNGEPLDMSHCVLRSVSPVHIEYLGNMGVKASMSVSIVINGRLWGMLACHHMSVRQVPYAVRMACDVLGQILAANLQTLVARDHSQHMEAAASLRSQVIAQMLHADDSLSVLNGVAGELIAALGAGALVLAEDDKVVVHGDGDLPEPAARNLIKWLGEAGNLPQDGLLATDSFGVLSALLASELGAWCGVLAMRFDNFSNSWLVLLRKEQVETIAWGGRPEKDYAIGPLGPRLTPRGSFDVWRETVRGKSEPWSVSDLEVARRLQDELVRATSARNANMSRAKSQLLAVLGHDLRDPLQSISMAANVLQRGEGQAKLGQRIQSSSNRMQRLISEVMDMSRLQGGLGLGFQFQDIDLARLVDDVIEETRLASPQAQFVKQLPASLMASVDPDRISQLLGNLLGNALHHGTAGEPILVQLSAQDGRIELDVSNTGAEIAPATAAKLFSPFKRESLGNARNRSGMGLGLYIAHEIMNGHSGTLRYTFADPYVVFSAVFPQARPA